MAVFNGPGSPYQPGQELSKSLAVEVDAACLEALNFDPGGPWVSHGICLCESVWKCVKGCESVWKGVKGCVCVCLSLSLSVRLFFSWAIDCWINSWAMTLMTQVSIQIIQGEAWPTSCGLSWGQEGMDWYNRYVNISSQMVHLHYVQTKNRQMQQIRIRFLSLVGGFNLPLWKILVTICYYSQSQYMEKKTCGCVWK